MGRLQGTVGQHLCGARSTHAHCRPYLRTVDEVSLPGCPSAAAAPCWLRPSAHPLLPCMDSIFLLLTPHLPPPPPLPQHLEELLPVLSQPTIGQYCQGYSLMFRRWGWRIVVDCSGVVGQWVGAAAGGTVAAQTACPAAARGHRHKQPLAGWQVVATCKRASGDGPACGPTCSKHAHSIHSCPTFLLLLTLPRAMYISLEGRHPPLLPARL